MSSSRIFGAFGVGPRVDRCESVRGPGVPRSSRAVCISVEGYGLVQCGDQRWCVFGQSTRICLLPSSQRSILIHTTGLDGASSLRFALTESSFEGPTPDSIHLTAPRLAATLNCVIGLMARVKLPTPAPIRRQLVRLAWPRPSVPIRLRSSRYRVDGALLQPSSFDRGSSDAD